MNNQTWNPDDYARHAGFVASMAADLVDVLAPQGSERILDLGCGDGALTAQIVARGARVLGVDSSAAQIEAAHAKGLDVAVADGEALSFEGGFHAVFSNAALHWMKRPDAVIDGVWRALEPGGRFVAEMGGAGNVRSVVDNAHRLLAARGIDPMRWHPWYFPTVEEYRARLEARGFAVESMLTFPRPTPQGGDVVHWLRLFAQSFASALPAEEREPFYAELTELLRPLVQAEDGRWVLDYVRLRFVARRPA